MTRGTAPPDETCHLSADTVLLANARTVTMREPTDCPPAYSARLAAAKARQVAHCWHIASASESVWRVDDGGEFSPQSFGVLFVAAIPNGYVMAITWAGAEGESSELLIGDSKNGFRTLNEGYRYWAPI